MTSTPRTRTRRIVIACTAAAAAAIPAGAHGATADYIFWADESGTTIGRVANQAGATPNGSFITGLAMPTSLSLYGSRLYWEENGGIGRAYTDGTDVQRGFISAPDTTDAVFAGRPCPPAGPCDPYIYYGVANTPSTNSVVRRNIDGTSPTTVVTTSDLGNKKPWGLGVKGSSTLFVSYVDMSLAAGIGALFGGSWDNPRWPGPSMGTPLMAVDSSYVYVSNLTAITRLQAGCSGGGAGCYSNTFVTNAASQSVRGVAYDDEFIYLVNKKAGNDSIGRVRKLDGTTDKNADYIPLPGEAYGIAVGSSSGANNGGNTDAGGGSTPASGSSSGSSPAPAPVTPSNTFTARRGGVKGNVLVTRVTVPGPGRITQRGTRPVHTATEHAAAARVTACTGVRTAAAAGALTITCRLNAATRAARRTGPVRVRLATTFRPTGGTARTSTQVVVLPRLRVRPSAVTG